MRNNPDQPTSVLDHLSDEEYDRRLGALIGPLMDRLDERLASDDSGAAELP